MTTTLSAARLSACGPRSYLDWTQCAHIRSCVSGPVGRRPDSVRLGPIQRRDAFGRTEPRVIALMSTSAEGMQKVSRIRKLQWSGWGLGPRAPGLDWVGLGGVLPDDAAGPPRPCPAAGLSLHGQATGGSSAAVRRRSAQPDSSPGPSAPHGLEGRRCRGGTGVATAIPVKNESLRR